MKRPAGIIASAIVLVFVSLFQALISLGAALAGAIQAPQRPLTHTFFYVFAAVFLLFAAWGLFTTVGVYRLRRWARISILIIGGCMAALGACSTIGLLLAMFITLPPTPGMDSAQGQAFMRIGLLVGALFYAIPLGIGIWWLVYFNRKVVRALFAGPADAFTESARPLLISIYAVLAIFGSGTLLLMAFSRFPAVLLTLILHGWGRVTLYLAFAVLQLAVGIGLWKLKEWARRMAIAFLAFGVVQMGVYLVRPSVLLAVTAETYGAFNLPIRPTVAPTTIVLQAIMCGISLLFTAAIAYMLHYYRARFAEPDQPVIQQPPAAL